MTYYENHYQDCYVKFDENILKIGNDSMERSWHMQEAIPVVCSLKNKRTNKEWLAAPHNFGMLDDPRMNAFYKEGITEGSRQQLSVDAEAYDDCGIAGKALKITVRLEYDAYLLDWIHIIYPGTSVMRSYIQATQKERMKQAQPQEVQKGLLLQSPAFAGDFLDSIPLQPAHCSWENIKFMDRTDDYDNLVDSSHGLIYRREQRFLHGNVLFVEDSIEEEGITFVKEGPSPFSYLGNVKCDFFMDGQNILTAGWGLEEKDFEKENTIASYGSAVILWDGSAENKYFSLNDYHNCRHKFVPEKDAFIMSNTWGDMSSDSKIGEAFLLEELKRAREIGINMYQIDDGWQNGVTCNSVAASCEGSSAVWEGSYYKTNPRFWTVHDTRLPNGLEPVAEYARENGIRLGLWFSPDSENAFENWEHDAQVLLELHQKYGISAFKMDGIRLENKAAEENLAKLMSKVITQSEGKVFFNMDTTAGTRGGYFGRVQYGSLFVENRFTGVFGKWPNYYPHCTLRNLWMLSRYYPSNRLQMEFLNVKRNTELYGDDVLAPAVCGLEYSFAVTMFANPLAWMELTGLDEESVKTLNRLIVPYLKIQGDILSGRVLPIGEEPDGTKWTGFQSVKGDGCGYLLIIRERSKKGSHTYTLWKEKGKTLKLEALWGYGAQESIQTDQEGKTVFTLNGPFSYALYKYSEVSSSDSGCEI